MSIGDLVGRWQSRAILLKENSAEDGSARLWEKAARELAAALTDAGDEPVGLDEAKLEGGYSRSSLRRFFREHLIPNVGTEDEPLMQRKYLPHKPGYVKTAPPAADEPENETGPVFERRVDYATAPAVSSRRQVARAVASS